MAKLQDEQRNLSATDPGLTSRCKMSLGTLALSPSSTAPNDSRFHLEAEQRLLLASSRTMLSQRDIIGMRDLLACQLEWHEVSRLAETHSVTLLLKQSLNHLGFNSVPADIATILTSHTHRAVANTLLHVEHLNEVLAMLAEHDINVLVWKGPTIAFEAYGGVALRDFQDLDLIVRPTDVSRARQLLESIGYSRLYRLTTRQERTLLRTGHEEVMARKGQLVELHWKIAKDIHNVRLGFEELWRRRRTIPIRATSVPALGVEDTLLTLCIHGATHAWQKLIWIVDIAEFIRAVPDIDWNSVSDEAARLGVRRSVCVALSLAHAALGAPIAEPMHRSVTSDPEVARLTNLVMQHLFQSGGARRAFVSFQIGLRESLLEKLAFVARALFKPAPEDWTLLDLPEMAYPLYYLIRPLRLLSHYGRPMLARHK